MLNKTILRISAFLILMFTGFYGTAQINREFAGKLFVNPPHETPLRDQNRIPVFLHLPFRTYDGTGNNISSRSAFEYGASDIALFREIPAQYGPTDPKNAMAGSTRPSAREISNLLCDEPVTHFNDRGLSTLIYVWGQFIDHDMTNTNSGATEYVPVPLPADEKIFNQDIPFFRSEVRAGTGKTTPRQQSNLITSWIDGSGVYGSDSVRARWMRTFHNGKMKTSAGNFLPWNTVNGEYSGAIDPNAPDMANDSGHTVKTFVAGDVRAAEHPGITGMHTLFVREHNRICDQLVKQGFKNDEIIYQLARKEVGALIQAITYQEFLPAMGVVLDRYTGYKPNVRPDIMNTFATAAYRIGHTMVADDILLRNNQCQVVAPGALDLIAVFWTPNALPTYQMETFLKGFASHTLYETDTRINSVLRNFLFNNINPADTTRFGIDLASLNIQRGRDHGLPDYNTVRKFYVGSRVTDFSQITHDSAQAASLKSLYGSVNNIDLWIGLLSEDHLPNASIGFTISKILKAQFEHLRDGDYYFYLNDPYLPFNMRNEVIRSKFSDVLERNTRLTTLQSNVFFTLPCPGETGEDSVAVVDSVLTPTAERDLNTTARIFPNPATNTLHVDFGSWTDNVNVRIFSTGNTLVKTQTAAAGVNGMNINISELPPGIYFISISNGKDLKTFKMVKNAN